MANSILSDQDKKLLKDLFKLDVDFRSDEELFSKVKENAVSFYRDKFGIDVNDGFNDISISSIATSEYWEKIYNAVLDLLYGCLHDGKECADIEKLKEIYTILTDKVNENNRSTFISHGGSSFRYIRTEMMELKAQFSAVFGKDNKINEFLNDFFVGAFYIGCNLDGKPSKYVFLKKQSCKPDVIELLATHEINHAIESSILYEDNNFIVYTSGWKIVVGNKKKVNGNSNLMFFSAEDRKLISDFLGVSFSELNSCLSSYDIEGLLFLLKNREKILPDEYYKLLSCSSLIYLNEAVNDYIAYNIFEKANGEIDFKPNYDYYSFFPLIKKFYDTFEDDIILSRRDGNISIILDKVGIDNIISLSELLDKYRNLRGSHYISDKDLIRESDYIVRLMVEHSQENFLKR